MTANPLAGDLNHILEHTGGLWEELRGKRIFITGGTGFFGCWLLESFLWANARLGLEAEAVVLSRDPEAFAQKVPHLARHPAISLHQGDIRSFSFPGGHFSHVIHAATESSVKLMKAEDPLSTVDAIVGGTRRALDFALQCGAKKFLLTSSGAVYGKQPSGLTHIPEDYNGAPDPMDTGAAYGNGKRLAEHLCALYAKQHGLETKIARCFAFVGPYQPLDAHFAIGNFIGNALLGQPVIIKGDGTPYRSYLYATDLIVWLLTILISGEPMRPYHVGSDVPVSIAELARLVARLPDSPVPVQILGTPKPETLPERYIPETRLTQASLGLQITVGIEEALRRTWAFHAASSKQPLPKAPCETSKIVHRATAPHRC
ncbi:MAG: NAD-dependent epimerase/dehydratase family protein [Verrucomicrobiota bacterium]